MDEGNLIQDRYALESRLGSGGMAEVWCAHDERLQRKVAVKFLAPRFAADPEFLVRFFAEAQSIARLSDAAVVSVLDFGEHEGRPYLVMEYLPGGSLDDLVGTPLLSERALELVAQAARGAGAAHAAGVIHRDVKPANILIDEAGNAKLADFGIASSDGRERLTATGAAIGSPHYISPEQVSGTDASPRSDVYSLGIVLYELLTGRKPFQGDNPTAVAISHVDRNPEPPSTHVPDLDASVEAIVLRCLAKDPEQRYADGTELAEALEGVAAGAFIPAPLPASTAAFAGEAADHERDEGTSRRGPLVGAAVVLTLLGLAAAVIFGGTEKAVSDEQPSVSSSADDDRKTSKKKASPSPTADVVTAETQPTPTPSMSSTEKDDGSGGKARATEEQEVEPDPEPSPTPSQEPTPEPTQEPSPAPTTSPAEEQQTAGDETDGTE